MLKGIACVVTNSGDSALIVGNTGCVAKISDPDSLASSIIKLLSLSIEERGGLGEAAKQRVKQNFMLENSVAKYSELYFNLSKS